MGLNDEQEKLRQAQEWLRTYKPGSVHFEAAMEYLNELLYRPKTHTEAFCLLRAASALWHVPVIHPARLAEQERPRLMKIYLSNKMSGIPYFNAPWFDRTAAALMQLGAVEVFNPAERDRARGFDPMSCPNGTFEEAYACGFDAAEALTEDWSWIAHHADLVVVGPDWRTSPGAISEVACIQARRRPAYEFGVFMQWHADERLHRYALPPILESCTRRHLARADESQDVW